LSGNYFSWAKHSRGYISKYNLDRNACKTTQGQIRALVVLKPGEQTVCAYGARGLSLSQVICLMTWPYQKVRSHSNLLNILTGISQSVKYILKNSVMW